MTPDGPRFRSTFLPRLPLAMVVLFCFLINRVWHVYYVSEPTPQLVYTACPFRLLSSCSPHWNSTMLSIPASVAPTFPCFPPSFLLLYLLSCSPTVSFCLLSVASTYLSASTTPRMLIVSARRWPVTGGFIESKAKERKGGNKKPKRPQTRWEAGN